MNKAIFMGRLTKDIELKYTQNDNKAVARFTLAVNRRGKDAGTDYIGCIAWGKNAELLQKYCKKGSQVGIIGRIQTGSYIDKDTKKVYTTDVVVEELDIIWDKKEESTMSQVNEQNQSTITDEDLPF